MGHTVLLAPYQNVADQPDLTSSSFFYVFVIWSRLTSQRSADLVSRQNKQAH